MDDSIAESHLGFESIYSIHIINYSITSMNLASDALTSDKFQKMSFTSSKFADDVITSKHIAINALTSADFSDCSISYNHIVDVPPTSNAIPGEYFSDLDLLTHFVPGYVSPNKFVDQAFTFSKFSSSLPFDAEYIIAPLTIEKGGTGSTGSFNVGELLFTATTNTIVEGESVETEFLSQSEDLRFLTPNDTDYYLTIGNAGNCSLNCKFTTSGNIFLETGSDPYSGVMIIQQYDTDSYQFISLDATSNSLYLSNYSPLTSPSPNMGVRAYNLYSANSLTAGGVTQNNSLDVYSGLSLGTTFRTISPPTDGLIIEESLQIGYNTPKTDDLDTTTYNVFVSGLIQGFSSDNVGIYSESTVPVMAQTNTFGINAIGATGIYTIGSSNAIEIANTVSSIGLETELTVTSNTYPGSSLFVDMQHDSNVVSFNAYLGYSSSEFNAGLYLTEPDTSLSTNEYAAYFDDAVNFAKLTVSDTV